jgi:ATP-binding protein involved in chromosome partitioning
MADQHPDLASQVRAALNALADPVSGKGLVDAGRVSGVVASAGGRVGFALETDKPDEAAEALRLKAERAARAVPGVSHVTAVLTAHEVSPAPRRPAPHSHAGQRQGATPPQQYASPPPGRTETVKPARAVIAVASGKGGVGKSTVAVNLAVAAARRGLRVGLLDADIFGPSTPTMLGTVNVRPTLTPDKKMIPPAAHGVVTMSIGYLVDPDKAVVWRGPMVMSALLQLLSDTDWGDLDILFIDTPPGTGEVQLTLAQRLPLDGVVIVSTPQEVALADVRRGAALFEKTHVPILGVIENMAWFEQPDGARAYIFGQGGAERVAGEMGLPFLGALPLMPALREGGDAGEPPKTGRAAEAFDLLADAIVEAASAPTGKPAPKIVFE